MNPRKFLTRRDEEQAASGGAEVNVGFGIKSAVARKHIRLNTNKWRGDLTGGRFSDHSLGLSADQTPVRLG